MVVDFDESIVISVVDEENVFVGFDEVLFLLLLLYIHKIITKFI